MAEGAVTGMTAVGRATARRRAYVFKTKFLTSYSAFKYPVPYSPILRRYFEEKA